jgi:hypothetical protein
MEVDVSYTENIHCMRNGALSVRSPGVYSDRSAGVPVGCAGGVPLQNHMSWVFNPLAGMAANDAAAERRLRQHSPEVYFESYEEKLNGYDLPLTNRRIRLKDRPKDWPTRVWQIR